MINWYKKHPNTMVQRILGCYLLKSKVTPEALDKKDGDKNFNNIKNQMLLDVEGGGVEFNWDFIVFEATEHQLSVALEPFSPKKEEPEEPKKEEKKESKIVDMKGNKMKRD